MIIKGELAIRIKEVASFTFTAERFWYENHVQLSHAIVPDDPDHMRINPNLVATQSPKRKVM